MVVQDELIIADVALVLFLDVDPGSRRSGLSTQLSRAPIEALSVREVKGFGWQKNCLDDYRAEETIRRIVQVARSGRMGDGKIFVLPAMNVGEAIDIASAPAATGKKKK